MIFQYKESMKILFFLILLIFARATDAQTHTPTGIPLDAEWKIKLNEFAIQHVVHQSWGYPHAERNFHLTLKLAELEGIKVDHDILFAAALLHDLGGLPPYEQKGVDHGLRSAEIGIPLLLSLGFPESKIDEVKKIIIAHIYYGPMPTGELAKLFRDADILDFLGTIGIARLLAANVELGKKPELENSIRSIKTFMQQLPKELNSKSAQTEAIVRVKEMSQFLTSLNAYTYSGLAQ